MSLIRLPIAEYEGVFRLLEWEEQYDLVLGGLESFPKAALIRALVSVQGVEISTEEEAKLIFSQLPKSFVSKLWLLYAAEVPHTPFYSIRGLYSAPEAQDVQIKSIEADEAVDAVAEKAFQAMEAKFGSEEMNHTRTVEGRIFEAAKKRGLQPARKEDV